MKHYAELSEVQAVEPSLPFAVLQRKLELVQRTRPQANNTDVRLRAEPLYEDLAQDAEYEQTIDINVLIRKIASQYNSSPLISMEAVLQAQQRALAALQELETALQQVTPSSKTLVPEVTETMERILHSVRTAVEPGTWAPSLEDRPQLTAPISLECSTPPLPTAEDMAKDPLKTWVGRDKKVRVRDADGNEHPETPLDFFQRVYAPWLGRITKGDIRRIDPKLYEALYNWMRRTGAEIPNSVLPNEKKRWGEISVSPEDMEIYRRVNALRFRRA